MRDSYLEDRIIDVLLRCCPSGFGRFVYESSMDPMPYKTAGREVTPQQLVRHLLARSKDTLRAVELDYSRPGRERYDSGDSTEYETKLTMADFAGFSKLQTMVHLTKEDWAPPKDW